MHANLKQEIDLLALQDQEGRDDPHSAQIQT